MDCAAMGLRDWGWRGRDGAAQRCAGVCSTGAASRGVERAACVASKGGEGLLPATPFLPAFGAAAGAVFARTATGRGGGSVAYSGGGVEGVEEALLSSEEEAELDFLRRSDGLTMAICEGLEESAMTTRASMGPLTRVCEVVEALRLRRGGLGEHRRGSGAESVMCSCGMMEGRGLGWVRRLKSWRKARQVSTRERSESCVSAW